MNDPVEILQQEHQLLLQAARVTKEIQKTEDDLSYRELIRDMILFLRNFTESYHHPKEEYHLYPLLQNRSAGMSREFIHEVCDNHEDFKALMAEIENNYVLCNYSLLRQSMDKYVDLLTEHIKREDRLILSVAGSLLSKSELEGVYREFMELDEKQGEKKELVNSFYRLNGLYAGQV
jgi:hemerythrin-like domain-containing protein